MKYLIVGLGNIGPEYAETRHNIGFMVLDYLAKKHDAQFDTGRHSFVTEIKTKGRTFVLVKPTTYMNLSGKAVQHWLSNLKLPVEQMMVITDDIAIPFGKIRIRTKGSAGGHNGLKHIEQTLGHNNYPRLRFGVGDSFHKGKQVDYVLSKFSDDESIELQTLIEKAADSVIAFGTIGLERTMNQYNTK
ncbi:aminoacyl-tRNA hydrolase [Pontibacter aydingkolensis]|uniref:Peptidyl-tRNA hydrolase n=1 Tax=Pontibacter aydingkolensis TaxID=1911536 RepID=A0ABS7CZF9_9BACT|nr:aminoacyl-tRNA hydrolase [Pontibacter aydingkolensis]MBW7469211.1 aminoacyl-tRNA hydrolase [Pontibacter aydingkolensis]